MSSRRITAALNRLPALSRVQQVVHCAMDTGERYALIFTYPDHRQLVVSVSPTGCRWAANGSRTVHVQPTLLSRLDRAQSGPPPVPR